MMTVKIAMAEPEKGLHSSLTSSLFHQLKKRILEPDIGRRQSQLILLTVKVFKLLGFVLSVLNDLNNPVIRTLTG